MTLLKTRTLLERNTHLPNDAGALFQTDEESVSARSLFIDNATWDEMGRPHVVTVTIEPGDMLNDDDG